MPIITPTVENPDELLAWPGPEGPVNRIQIERSDTGAGAGYANIGSVTITAGTRSYTYYDPNGDVSDWYRWYFSNAANTFPASSNRVYSDELQPGPETGNLLCAVEDVEQELGTTLTANERENVLEKIRRVTTAIENYTNRWFVPRPLSGDTTYRFHSEYGSVVHIPKGIRSITTLGVATTNQPESGGSYTTYTDGYLDPPAWERGDWPAFFVRFPVPGSRFFNATFGIQITGKFGWARVPYDIQGVAVNAVVRSYIGKAAGGAIIATGPSGEEILLPGMSGTDRDILMLYRQIPA